MLLCDLGVGGGDGREMLRDYFLFLVWADWLILTGRERTYADQLVPTLTKVPRPDVNRTEHVNARSWIRLARSIGPCTPGKGK